jgi:hypothetical protein
MRLSGASQFALQQAFGVSIKCLDRERMAEIARGV